MGHKSTVEKETLKINTPPKDISYEQLKTRLDKSEKINNILISYLNNIGVDILNVARNSVAEINKQ